MRRTVSIRGRRVGRDEDIDAIMTGTLASYVFLGFAIISEVIATTALKASHGMSRLGPSAVVVIGYALAFYLITQSLKTLPLGLVYGLWAGLGIVGAVLAGVIMFDEPLGAVKLIGIAMIVGGTVVLKSSGA